jgi:hypothetical protein
VYLLKDYYVKAPEKVISILSKFVHYPLFKYASIAAIKQNPPYDMMVDLTKILCGRRTASSNEPILTSLHNLLVNFGSIKSSLDSLDSRLSSLVRSERVSGMDFLL